MKLKQRVVLKSLNQTKILKNQNKCTLPSNITKLEWPILRGFDIVDMSLCKSLYAIPENFFYCDNLQTLILPDNKEIVIGENAFKYSNVEKIENSSSIREIKEYAFSNCANLKTFDFSNVCSIENNAFAQSGLAGKVVLPKSCTSFGKNVFERSNVTALEVNGDIKNLHNTFLVDTKIRKIRFANVGFAQDILSIDDMLEELSFDKIGTFSQNRSISAPKLSLKFGEDTVFVFKNENDTIKTDMHSLECFATHSDIYLTQAKIQQVVLWRNDKNFVFSLESNDILSVWDNNVFVKTQNFIYAMSNKFGNYRINVKGTGLLVPHNEYEEHKFFEVYRTLAKINRERNKSYFLPDKDVILNCKIEDLENCLKNYRQYNLLKNMFKTDIYNMCSALGLFEFPDGQNMDQNVKYEILRAKIFEGLKKLSCFSNKISCQISNVQHREFNPRRTAFFLENLDAVLPKAPEIVATFFEDVFEKFDVIEQYHKNKSGKLTKMSLVDFYNIKMSLENKNDNVSAILCPYLINEDAENQKQIFETANKLMSDANELQSKLEARGEAEITSLKDNSKSNYTFEFLKHNDSRQLVLGYECDSCARPSIHAAGYGILHSSMTDKNYYTFVIKDKNKNIIGKATMCVVDNNGVYAVINSLELKEQLREQKYKTIYDFIDDNIANQIMDTVERAIQNFCQQYKQTFSKEIFAVSMGLDTNDLRMYYKKRYAQCGNSLLDMPRIPLYLLGNNAQEQAIIYSTLNKTIKNKDITNEF